AITRSRRGAKPTGGNVWGFEMNGTTGSSITCEAFGQLGGDRVQLYTLKNRQGWVLGATTYGAAVTQLHVPDRNGRLADVVLGFDDLRGYVEHTEFFGATVGRVANRIRGGAFELEGRRHELARTDGPHHLHGGRRGWDKVSWRPEPKETPRGPSLELHYTSPDGEEGYPGRVEASTTYTLGHDGALTIEMRAFSDAPTIVNMANHIYWNLAGHGAATALDHELTLDAEFYTPGDPVVPVGELIRVAGTPFDFRSPKPIGRDLARVGNEPVGYDHNWVVNGVPGALRPVARLRHPASGRTLSLEADAPGVQFYSGNFLTGDRPGKGGRRYGQHAGVCLETQAFPNSINVPEWEGQVVLLPGQQYKHVMVLRFSAD
ncbi:MAG TPA: aldose epimerase family protein, partial [Polyangiaceae bacterium]|nr:aldose epimerase family protein [Polyangiaceae bacterium]